MACHPGETVKHDGEVSDSKSLFHELLWIPPLHKLFPVGVHMWKLWWATECLPQAAEMELVASSKWLSLVSSIALLVIYNTLNAFWTSLLTNPLIRSQYH